MAHQHPATGQGKTVRVNPFHRPNTVTAVHVSAAVEARRTQRGAPWHSLFTLVTDDDANASAHACMASLPSVDRWRRKGRECYGRECHVLRVPGGLAAAEQTLVERMVPYTWPSYDSDSDSDSGSDSGGWGLLLITDAEWTGQVGTQLMLMSQGPAR